MIALLLLKITIGLLTATAITAVLVLFKQRALKSRIVELEDTIEKVQTALSHSRKKSDHSQSPSNAHKSVPKVSDEDNLEQISNGPVRIVRNIRPAPVIDIESEAPFESDIPKEAEVPQQTQPSVEPQTTTPVQMTLDLSPAPVTEPEPLAAKEPIASLPPEGSIVTLLVEGHMTINLQELYGRIMAVVTAPTHQGTIIFNSRGVISVSHDEGAYLEAVITALEAQGQHVIITECSTDLQASLASFPRLTSLTSGTL